MTAPVNVQPYDQAHLLPWGEAFAMWPPSAHFWGVGQPLPVCACGGVDVERNRGTNRRGGNVSARQIAIAAHLADEAERLARRQREDEDRRDREAELDAPTLAWVKEHPFIARHFPDVEWVLVSREEGSANIQPVGDDVFEVRVSQGDPNAVRMVAYYNSQTRQTLCMTLAEIGRWVKDEEQRALRAACSEIAAVTAEATP